jgi:hypothetical protein
MSGKLARTESRRRRREAGAASLATRDVPAPDEAAERLDVRRQVLDALQRLGDPQRYALFLRYFEDLTPAAIAARQEVPVTTVKSWLKRGLERLRADLDARHGGNRAAWHAALLPLGAAPVGPAVGPHVAPAAGVGTATKAAVAVGVLAVGVVAVGWLAFGPRSNEPTSPPRETARAGADTGARLEGRAVGTPHVADGRTAAPPAPPARVEMPGDVVYFGRVVDDRRRSISGANVRLHVPGYPERGTTTDLEGRFRVALGPRTEAEGTGVAHVSTGDGRAVTRHIWAEREEASRPVDMRTLVLAPARDLAFVAVRDGKPVPGARVSICVAPSEEMAQVVTDAEGRGMLRAVPAGEYRLLAAAPGHGRGSLLHKHAIEGGGPALVTLAAPRGFDVRVTDASSGQPVSGAVLVVSEKVPFGTYVVNRTYLPALADVKADEQGRARLEGLAPGTPILLTARAPGYATAGQGYAGEREVPEYATEFTLALDRARTLSWALKAGERPVPADGTAFTITSDDSNYRLPLPEEGRVEGGKFVASGFSPSFVQALAQARDGAYLRLAAKANEEPANAIAVRSMRKVEVVVHFADGTPAAGLPIEVRAQGAARQGPPATLDAEGRAVVPIAHDRIASVFVGQDSPRFDQHKLGEVDLRQGDARFETTLPPERAIRLHVRIGGEARLPAEFSAVVNGPHSRPTREDAEQGLVTLYMGLESRPPGPVPVVFFSADGFVPAELRVVMPPGNDPVDADLDLQPAGTLVMRVKKPRDGTAPNVTAQVFDDVRQTWRALPPPPPPPPGTDGSRSFEQSETEQVFRITPLPEGRYRAMDQNSGELTGEVHLVPGGPPSEVTLDLSRAGTVRGQVEVPRGFDPTAAQVEIEGAPEEGFLMFPPGRVWVSPEGTFQVRVPGSRPVVLRGVHPQLVPDPVAGRLGVTEGRDDVRLKLVAGTRARFRLAGQPPTPAGQAARVPQGLRVVLFPGAPGTVEGAAQKVRVHDGALWFTGYAPGTYTLWLDSGRDAPLVKRGVVFGAQETDLGDLERPAGAPLRVRLLLKEGTTPPQVAVRAVAEGQLVVYERVHQTFKNVADPVLTGLGPGRFHVTVWTLDDPPGVAGRRLEKTIEVPEDSEAEVAFEFDLR